MFFFLWGQENILTIPMSHFLKLDFAFNSVIHLGLILEGRYEMESGSILLFKNIWITVVLVLFIEEFFLIRFRYSSVWGASVICFFLF